jgi:hypothetical protein
MEVFVHVLANTTKIHQTKTVYLVIILVKLAQHIRNALLVMQLTSDMQRFRFLYAPA